MKNLLSLLFINLLFIAACSTEPDDNNEPERTNTFVYDGVNYETNSFGLFFYDTNHFEMIFSTGTYDNSCNCLVGTDEIQMSIDVYSYQNGDISSGSYTNSTSNAQGTFKGGYESFSDKLTYDAGVYNWGSAQGANNSDIIGGQLEIDNTNSIYTVEYTFNLADGNQITGYYKGPREYFWID